jgi:hypothetical protein
LLKKNLLTRKAYYNVKVAHDINDMFKLYVKEQSLI